jgi:hypothetical protein
MKVRRKHKITMYLAWDYDREEAYMNSMAAQGWQLKKGGLFHHTYEKSDGLYRYKLDFNSKVTLNPDEYNRYLTIFEEQGWEQINATINGWHYFRKLYEPGTDEEDYELYTDTSSLKEMLGRWNKIARMLQIFYFIYLLFNIIYYSEYGNLISQIASILGLLAIVMFQVGIYSMKGKKLSSSNKKSSKGTYAGYVLFSGIVVSFLIMLYLLTFGFYVSKIKYTAEINNSTPDYRDELSVKKDGFYLLDINGSTERGILMIQLSKDGSIIHNCGGADFTLKNKRLFLKKGNYNVNVIYYLEDYKDIFHVSKEQLEELNLTGVPEEASEVKVFVGIKR